MRKTNHWHAKGAKYGRAGTFFGVFLLVNASPLLSCSRRSSVRSAAYTTPNVPSSLFSMPPGRERVAGRSRSYRNGGCDRRRDGSKENQSRNPGDCELVRWDLDRSLASRFSSALGTIRVSHCYSAMSPPWVSACIWPFASVE